MAIASLRIRMPKTSATTWWQPLHHVLSCYNTGNTLWNARWQYLLKLKKILLLGIKHKETFRKVDRRYVQEC